MNIILGTMTFSDQVEADAARQMIERFHAAGHRELDTAYVYNKGGTETLLGELRAAGLPDGLQLAGKANPWAEGGLAPASVRLQLETSLQRTGLDAFDLFYLHAPDLSVPVLDTLAMVASLHEEGRFKRFGLSNFAAWQVAEVCELCRQRGWLLPTVYQGMYNALTRDVERELLPCLANFGMAFNVYNPLAGGLLSGKHHSIEALPADGRFASFDGYQDRYWKPEYFAAINALSATCREHAVEPAAAALRWLVHHSALAGLQADDGREDGMAESGIIVGASSLPHLDMNLQAVAEQPLPGALVKAFDEGWETVRPACIKYFRP